MLKKNDDNGRYRDQPLRLRSPRKEQTWKGLAHQV